MKTKNPALKPARKSVVTEINAALKGSIANTEIQRVNMPHVCNVLKDLRIKANLDHKTLASRTGLPKEYLIKLEAAQDAEIKISTLIIILDALGYDLLIKPKAERFA